MDIFYFTTSFVFFLWTVRNIFNWVALWQTKEYRLDRMIIHLWETGQGKKILFSPLSLIKVILILFYGYIVFHDEYIFVYQIIIALVYFVEAGLSIKSFFSNSNKRPEFTIKVQLLIFPTLLFSLIAYSIPLLDKYVWLLILDKIIPGIIAILIAFFSFPTEIRTDSLLRKATKKIKSKKKLIVVGITGSYGKSSTKYYLYQILATKYNVLATSYTDNSFSTLAKIILDRLSDATKVFIVEMGGTKKGEIAEFCHIVKPKIGIVTGLNEQNLSFFKNIENTKEAKYELVDAIPKNGFMLFNGNNDILNLLYNKTKKNKFLYTSYNANTGHERIKPDIYAENITVKQREIQFDVFMQGERLVMHAPLLGAHNVENILPAIFVARHLGMKNPDIKAAVAKLHPLTKTMNMQLLFNSTVVIDDTLNENTEAVIAAIRYMRIYKGKRILVMQPLIELGKKSYDEHFRIGKEASDICDYIFLTNTNHYKSIYDGIQSKNGKCVVGAERSNKIVEFIVKETGRNDVVTFEGREANNVLDRLLTYDEE